MTAYIVVRVEDRDVARLRGAIHEFHGVADAVFRKEPNRFNFGIELYPTLHRDFSELLRRAKEALDD